jgi:tetratricopeptide (TPR) repeat protein
LAFSQGDNKSARQFYESSMAICRELGDQKGMAGSLNNLGMVEFEEADYSKAKVQFEASLDLWRELKDHWGIANSFNNLGSLASTQGDFAGATRLYEESVAIWRDLGDKWGIANSLTNIGASVRDQGDLTGARPYFLESLAIQRDLGDKWGIAVSLENLAVLAVGCPDPLLAPRLWGAAAALREEIGSPLMPVDQVRIDAQVTAAKKSGDPAMFDAAWAEGRMKSTDEVIEWALMETRVVS